MPRKKTIKPGAPAPSAPPSGASVTYIGEAPINFRGHDFMPGKPVSGLPDEVVAMARVKAQFRVSDVHAD